MSPRSCPPPPPIDPTADPDEVLAGLAKALAHPARVRILRFLLRQDECVAGSIVDELPLAQSTVSQHLKVLREAGLIAGEVDGPRICYCANPDRLNRIHSLLESLTAQIRAREEPCASH